MPVQKIIQPTQKVSSAVRETVQRVRTHKPMNSFEFHAGFVPPQKHPLGMNGLNKDADIERIIDSLV